MEMKKTLKKVLACTALVSLLGIATAPAMATEYVTDGLVFNIDVQDPASYNPDTGELKDIAGTVIGTKVGNPAYDADKGALKFLGSDHHTNYYDLGVTTNFLAGASAISLEVEFASSGQEWERIFDFGDGQQDNNFLLSRNGGANELFLMINNGTTSFVACKTSTGDTALETGVMAKWTITMDGTTCRFYKDGVEVNTISENSIGPVSYDIADELSSPFEMMPTDKVFNKYFLGASHWGGDFDSGMWFRHLRIYNILLTPKQIAQNAGLVPFEEKAAENTLADTGYDPTAATIFAVLLVLAGLLTLRASRRN